MPTGNLKTLPISCRGGLIENENISELASKPGFAIKLENFEPVSQGGYKKINGYEVWDVTLPGSGEIRGVFPYKGYLLFRGQHVYHSFDKEEWVQVNKDTGNPKTFVDEAELATSPELPRDNFGAEYRKTNGDFYTFGDAEDLDVFVFADGSEKTGFISIKGTNPSNASYCYHEYGSSHGVPDYTNKVVMFADRAFVLNDKLPSTLTYSNRFEVNIFSGSSSGSVTVDSPILDLKPFRDELYLFCRDKIYKFINVDTAPQIVAVTKNIGVVAEGTVQEIGGDLVFLAPDGLRSIAATDRIEDVELSALSANITQTMQQIVDEAPGCYFSSVVIRDKSQYRLFVYNPTRAKSSQRGIIATLSTLQGQTFWSFSTTIGLEVANICSSVRNNEEEIIHVNSTEEVCTHDYLYNFGNLPIRSRYITPYFDMGDSNIRKNLHQVRLVLMPFANTNLLKLNVAYDFRGDGTYSPSAYAIEDLKTVVTFGTAVFGISRFVNTSIPYVDTKVSGSGFYANIELQNNELNSSFLVTSMSVTYDPSGYI
jgi:hypothetical protein